MEGKNKSKKKSSESSANA